MSEQFLSLLQTIARQFARVNEVCGRLVSSLIIVMVLLICFDVGMRYLFQQGSVGLQELEWHLFSVIFLLGAGYTLKHDDHVRVDVFYHAKYMSQRGRAWINLFGCLVFLIPFCLLVILQSWPFVHNAYVFAESSPDPGGLPYRWLLKSAIPLGFSLLLLQGISELLQNALTLLAREK